LSGIVVIGMELIQVILLKSYSISHLVMHLHVQGQYFIDLHVT